MPPGHCLGALETLQLNFYNFLVGCPLPRRKCQGAIALSKWKHTVQACMDVAGLEQHPQQFPWCPLIAVVILVTACTEVSIRTFHSCIMQPWTSLTLHRRQQMRLPPCPCLGASEKFQDKFTFSPYVKSVPYQRKIIVPLQKQRGLVLNLLCCTTGTMYGCTVIMNRLT